MPAPRIDIFDWLHVNVPKATYNLAYSNIYGVSLEEYQRLVGYSLPKQFDLGVNASYGAEELKETLQRMYQCSLDNIVTTTGGSEANFLIFSSLVGPGDEFIIEQPSYQPMGLTLEMLGGKRISWQRRFEERYRLEVEVLTSLVTPRTKVIALTNLHNPGGVWAGRKTIEALAKVAEAHGIYIVIDEIYLDGAFRRHPSSFGLPHVIVTSSATKVYGLGGLHTGWIIAPPEIVADCQRRKEHVTGASSLVSELMTAHAFGVAREMLRERFQKRARQNHNLVKKWIGDHRDVLEWVEPDGGIYCFPRYHLDAPSVPLCTQILAETGVLVNPGAYFNQEGHLRLAYGLETEVLATALQLLGDTLEKLRRL